MRIGIDARMYGAKATTGIGVYIKKLTDNLFEIDQSNEYFLFMLDPEFSSFTPPNPRVHKVKVKSHWYSIFEQFEMLLVLLRYNLDLVHFPQFNVPVFYPKKFVVMIHDITQIFFPGARVKKNIIRKVGFNLVFKSALKHSEKILVNTNHTKKSLVDYFKTPAEKIEVIYLGFDKDQSSANPETVKQKYNITKPFILYVGVWREHKNLVSLVKAFEIVKSESNFDLQLVLAGPPDQNYLDIQKRINESKYKSDIIAPGFVPDKDLSSLYAAAELFVLPSFHEGFGLAALEAVANQTPVISSVTTAVSEILGPAALYFDPKNEREIADKINIVLSEKTVALDLVNAGQKVLPKYSWKKTAEQTLEIYQKV